MKSFCLIFFNFSFLLLLLILSSLIILGTSGSLGCSKQHINSSSPNSSASVTAISTAHSHIDSTQNNHNNHCIITPRDHLVFNIYIDGKDAGREVRSTHFIKGPLGNEILTLSHLVRRLKSEILDQDRFTIRSELTSADNGFLLRGSFVSVNQLSFILSLVGFNGIGWDRIVETRESITDDIYTTPFPVELSEQVLIGFRLNDHLRKISLQKADYNKSAYYYLPSSDSEVAISFSKPVSDIITFENQKIKGFWVSAYRQGTQRIIVKIFFDEQGLLLEEYYPSIHQRHKRSTKPLSIPTESINSAIGLFSKAYLGLPNSATKAKFVIESKNPLPGDILSLLKEPLNQTLTKKDSTTYKLTVITGGPDGINYPTKDDLKSTKYINSSAKYIVNAYQYLRFAGKKGSLDYNRKQNAIPIIAKVSRITNPKKFWKTPDKVAKIVMDFVYAILPTKHHTFSMSDAVTALKNGSGDCTEHSVLFASIMRAAKIPTRLVSGIYLARGGSWVYHMWAEYWDGNKWHSIDAAVGPTFHPGALYISLGFGVSKFKDIRNSVANFLDHVFSGISINLVEASANGESLHLAIPKNQVLRSFHTTIFNAATMSSRGNHNGALKLVESKYNPNSSPLGLNLFRAELYYNAGQYNKALETINALRSQTSLASNILFLNQLELKTLISLQYFNKAFKVLQKLAITFKDNEAGFVFDEAYFLFYSGKEQEAVALLDSALANYPNLSPLLIAFSQYVATMETKETTAESKLLKLAFSRAKKALFETLYTDVDALVAMALVHLKEQRFSKALTILEHALIMAPFNKTIKALYAKSVQNCNKLK